MENTCPSLTVVEESSSSFEGPTMEPDLKRRLSKTFFHAPTYLTLQIDNQDSFPGHLFDALALRTYNEKIVGRKMSPITRFEFICVWKAHLYQRALDLNFIRHFNKPDKPDNFINLQNCSVPAPLADLMHVLGTYESAQSGRRIHILPPEIDATCPPDWYRVSRGVMDKWQQMMLGIQSRYTLKICPSKQKLEGSAICLTSRAVDPDTGLTSIHALTTEPSPNDAYMRLLFDELFDKPVVNHEKMGLCMVYGCLAECTRSSYCCSYWKNWW